jgi:hypothetical protein
MLHFGPRSTKTKFGDLHVAKYQALHGLTLEQLYLKLKAEVLSAKLDHTLVVVPTKAWITDTKLYVR